MSAVRCPLAKVGCQAAVARLSLHTGTMLLYVFSFRRNQYAAGFALFYSFLFCYFLLFSYIFCFVLFVFIWGDSLLSFRRTPNKGAWSIPIGPCHRLMRCLCIPIAPTGNRTRACRVTGEDFGTAPRVWPLFYF